MSAAQHELGLPEWCPIVLASKENAPAHRTCSSGVQVERCIQMHSSFLLASLGRAFPNRSSPPCSLARESLSGVTDNDNPSFSASVKGDTGELCVTDQLTRRGSTVVGPSKMANHSTLFGQSKLRMSPCRTGCRAACFSPLESVGEESKC